MSKAAKIALDDLQKAYDEYDPLRFGTWLRLLACVRVFLDTTRMK